MVKITMQTREKMLDAKYHHMCGSWVLVEPFLVDEIVSDGGVILDNCYNKSLNFQSDGRILGMGPMAFQDKFHKDMDIKIGDVVTIELKQAYPTYGTDMQVKYFTVEDTYIMRKLDISPEEIMENE